jgi:hypothetical protein
MGGQRSKRKKAAQGRLFCDRAQGLDAAITVQAWQQLWRLRQQRQQRLWQHRQRQRQQHQQRHQQQLR